MKILVVTNKEPCIAGAALASEFFAHEFSIITADNDYSYGEALGDYWLEGTPFINVEHDIAPWPGALQALWDCPEPYCGYNYMLGNPGALRPGIGCIKITPWNEPSIGMEFGVTKWYRLDAIVFKHLGMYHIHEPPVAHLMTLKEVVYV